jgi:hypothetical protein
MRAVLVMVVLLVRLGDGRDPGVGPCLGGWSIRLSAPGVPAVIVPGGRGATIGDLLRPAAYWSAVTAVTTDVHEHHAAHQAGEGDRRERDDPERDEHGRDGHRRDRGE